MLRALLVVLVMSGVARAGEKEQVRQAMHTYYAGEVRQVIPWSLTGLATGVTGGVLVTQPGDLAKTSGGVMLGLGIFELAVGVGFALRTLPMRERFDLLLDSNPQEFVKTEREHLHRIVTRFQPIVLITEAVLAAAGASLTLIGMAVGNPRIEGVGIGVGAHALTLFAIDWAVLDRALAYSAALDAWSPAGP
jgi:hypothetical protein